MTTVDLITGFLGAGKTTFIKKCAEFFKSSPEKIAIIENEFGAAGIDSNFLSNTNFKITELSGGCICCALKIGFFEQLMDLSDEGYNRIIVEPSGIYNADEFFKTMNTAKVQEKCQIGSVIMVVDPGNFDLSDNETNMLMTSQLSHAGIVLINNKENSTVRDLESTIQKINDICPGKHILSKPWNALTGTDIISILNSGYYNEDKTYVKGSHAVYYKSLTFSIGGEDINDIESKIFALFNGSCGDVLRVKGYASDKSGKNYEINCTKKSHHIVSAHNVLRNEVNVIVADLDKVGLDAMIDILGVHY